MTHTDHRRTDPSVPRTASFRPKLQSSQQEYTSNAGAIREGLTNVPEHPLPSWTPNSSATSSGDPWGHRTPSVLEDHEDSIVSRKKTFKDPSGNVVGVSIKAKRRGREASPAREEVQGFSPGSYGESPGIFFAFFKSQELHSPKIGNLIGPPIAQMQTQPQLSLEDRALQAPSLDALSISISSRIDLGYLRRTSSKSRLKTVHSLTNLSAVAESPNIEAEATEEDSPDPVTSHEVSRQQQGHDTNHPWTGSHSNQSQSERKRRTSFANPTKSGAGDLARQLKNVHIDQPIDAHAGGNDRQYHVSQHPQSAQYQYPIGDYNTQLQFTSDYSPTTETVANQTNQPQWVTPREFSLPNQPVASAGVIQTQQPYPPSPYTAGPASGGPHLGHESAGNPTPAPSMDHYAPQQQGNVDVSNLASPDTPQDLGGRGYPIKRTAGEKELDSRKGASASESTVLIWY
jgi:hypothetical protein